MGEGGEEGGREGGGAGRGEEDGEGGTDAGDDTGEAVDERGEFYRAVGVEFDGLQEGGGGEVAKGGGMAWLLRGGKLQAGGEGEGGREEADVEGATEEGA